MDFDDTPAEAAFRAEARAWLDDHATLRHEGSSMGGYLGQGEDHVERCKRWQRTLYDGGWAGLTWPKEYGGRGATAIEAAIFNQEQARYEVEAGVFMVATGMVGPTLIAHGTDAQKERFLDPILRGEEIWCQLFSEPGAGSDLANLSTKAVLDGDEFVVNGQKVWTSGAQHSDWGILLVRTDPDQPKHRGITYLLVDMRTPGIDVRPLHQINGSAHFNEVFLSDVRVPVANLLGEIDKGWGPILTTLANERTAIGGGGGVNFGHLEALARECGRADDPLVRQELMASYTRFQILRYVGYRVQTALSQGRPPGAESSIMKLAYSQHLARNADLVLALEGAGGMLAGADAVQAGVWQEYFLMQWASRIGGGTDQIQRNVLGERVLGLPPEPRLDKALPFRDLPKS
ncbi:MAG: acyl-CoA dehydrogenase family protein [Acidimicrobiales bacterium]|nr:acyl-CoA dehydrogenase family protein [Acidimicrobiales bacterium]